MLPLLSRSLVALQALNEPGNTMQTESLLTLLQLFAGLAFCAPWPDFSYTIKNGQTRLLSNSFGEPGIDATYDYIVSINLSGHSEWR